MTQANERALAATYLRKNQELLIQIQRAGHCPGCTCVDSDEDAVDKAAQEQQTEQQRAQLERMGIGKGTNKRRFQTIAVVRAGANLGVNAEPAVVQSESRTATKVHFSDGSLETENNS